MAIRDIHGNIFMDKDKMKESWTEHCRDPYNETEQTDKNLLKELRDISQPDEDDEMDVILYEEVDRAVNHLKKNKSPGTDGVVGEMIKAGGDEMIKAIN